jgi:hypothetical protein
MPSRDQLEIIHPDGRIEFRNLDPATGILNIGRHPDNDVVLQGLNVRPFHALLDHRQSPYQMLLLDEQGTSTSAQDFTVWQNLRIGDYALVLISGAGSAMPHSAFSPQDLQTSPAEQAPPAQEDEAAWRVQPGKVLTSALTIHNSGGDAATFRIYIQGIDPAWVHFSQQEVRLAAGERVDVQMQIAPPMEASTQPGGYTLSWMIVSPDYPDWQKSESVTIMVEPFRHVAWGSLEPASFQSALFRRSGSTRLALTNVGNQPVDYVLWGKDLRDECQIHFEASGKKAQARTRRKRQNLVIHLPPGMTRRVKITLTPTERRLLGVSAHRSRFMIYGGFPDERQASHSATGTFEGYPLINVGVILVFVLLLTLAALFIYREQVGQWVDIVLMAPVGAQPIQAAAPAAPAVEKQASVIGRMDISSLQGTGGQRTQPDELSLEEIFKEAGKRYNIDWRILASLAYRESLLDPKAKGGSGELGLMQIMPSTWQEWAPLVQVQNPWDPYSNVIVGAAYLSYLRGYFRDLGYNDHQWALAAYNWGPERVLTLLDQGARWHELPLPQRQYVADILMGVEKAPARVQAAEREVR